MVDGDITIEGCTQAMDLASVPVLFCKPIFLNDGHVAHKMGRIDDSNRYKIQKNWLTVL